MILIFDMVVNATNYVLNDCFTLFGEPKQHSTVTTLCLLWYFLNIESQHGPANVHTGRDEK